MGIVSSAAKGAGAVLKAAPAPLNSNKYWSFAALDAIDSPNYLPMTRNGVFTPLPRTKMQIHGHSVDEKEGWQGMLPFGQAGWVFNTAKHKKMLEDRATQANYLRCIKKDKYQVYRRDARKLTTVRTCGLVLALTEGKTNTEAKIGKSSKESKKEANSPQLPLSTGVNTGQVDRPPPTRLMIISLSLDDHMASICAPIITIRRRAPGDRSKFPDIEGGDI